MTRLLLHLTLHGETLTRTIPDSPATPADLAQAVHHHARGHLAGHRVDIHLNDDTSGTVTSHGATVGCFTITPDDEPAADPGPDRDDQIRWGYTLTDLQRLARTAVLQSRFLNPGGGWHDRYDEALSAIYMQLCSSDDRPHHGDLLHAADRAITDLIRSRRRDRGYREGNDQYGIKWHPQFFRYWHHDPGAGLDERIAERVAVHQILAVLPEHERAAVEALAACGYYDTAAEALGITVACLKKRLKMARRTFLRLWYYPEAPARRWQQDRRRATNPPKAVCGNGHPYTPETTGFRSAGRRRGERYCKACSRASRVRSTARRAGEAAA